MSSGVWVIVVAAGSGSRAGTQKQFGDLAGQRVIDRTLAGALAIAEGVVVVLPPERPCDSLLPAGCRVVTGAATRSGSVRAGLAAVPSAASIILVHDGARPLASEALYLRVIAAVRGGAEAVIPGTAVIDSLRCWKVEPGEGGAVDRDNLVAVQTPQGFLAQALRDAHTGKEEATDDATVVEANGGRVEIVAGDPTNIKITNPTDFPTAEALLAESCRTGEIPFRVGQAFDIHARCDDPTRPLVLGGVTFCDASGLHGHSDADVVAHVCADALLGAAGLGDIGQMFPDTDQALAGADSLALLQQAASAVRAARWRPANIDCSVVLDTPKIAPEKERMQQKLSNAVGAPVTVTGRRTEGVGALGRGDGIAAWAVALIAR